jgi:hypothetical protein
MAVRMAAVAGAFPALAAPTVRRMPCGTARAPSWLVGGSRLASLCRRPMAAARRPMVEASALPGGRDHALVGREWRGATGRAPGGEVAPVTLVAAPGGLALLRLGEFYGGVDLGDGEGAGGCRIYQGQVVQGPRGYEAGKRLVWFIG